MIRHIAAFRADFHAMLPPRDIDIFATAAIAICMRHTPLFTMPLFTPPPLLCC